MRNIVHYRQNEVIYLCDKYILAEKNSITRQALHSVVFIWNFDSETTVTIRFELCFL